jgi:hypothetical protein
LAEREKQLSKKRIKNDEQKQVKSWITDQVLRAAKTYCVLGCIQRVEPGDLLKKHINADKYPMTFFRSAN